MRVASVTAVVVFFTMCLSAQSLVELAKKEKERRKELDKKGTQTKVITAEDLPNGVPESTPPPSLTPSSPPEETEFGGSTWSKGSPKDSLPSELESDRRRQQAINKLEPKFQQLVVEGRALVETARSFVSSNCMESTGTPSYGCQTLGEKLFHHACYVGTTLDEVDEIARKGFLVPGVVRDAREATGLDDRFWNDIQRLSRKYCKNY